LITKLNSGTTEKKTNEQLITKENKGGGAVPHTIPGNRRNGDQGDTVDYLKREVQI